MVIRGDFVVSATEPLLLSTCRRAADPHRPGCCYIVAHAKSAPTTRIIIEIKEEEGADGHPLDNIPFHPYYTVRTSLGVG